MYDYKDFVMNTFNGKIIKSGEVIDTRQEIIDKGLDIAEYGKVYSEVYSTIIDFMYFEFEIVERENVADPFDFLYYKVDDETNLVFKNSSSMDYKITIEYSDSEFSIYLEEV